MHIAIVGSGIAGLGAANELAGPHDVTLFEAAARPGGHVYTVDVPGLAGTLAVDMGFIVCNRARYPRFCALLAGLGIATRPTTMSFSVSLPASDLEWGSANLSALFADRRRLLAPRHWRFLARVARFVSSARRDLGSPLVAATTLDEYLAARQVDPEVRTGFVVPLAAALWSLAPDRCGAFPASTYLEFLDQHGMLDLVNPLPWRTVVGGSRRYVEALLARLELTGRLALHTGTAVTAIERDARGVTLTAGGTAHRADAVIIATHADTALRLLAAPSDHERQVLGAFRYSRNRTVLHRDRRALPRRAAAHAAWNYRAEPDTAQVAVTYSMTRLQGLPDDPPYLVTLNPRGPLADTLHEVSFDHPQLDRAAIAAQPELAALGNDARTFYAGAHFGYGFHEDGLRTGIAAAERARRLA